jgi:hypothetical protein
MGANFCTLTFDGELTRDEVRGRFDAAVDQSLYESGHSYSGEIGMATGLMFMSKTFESQQEAYEWVSDAAEKWGPALCVRYKAPGDKEFWYIGAMCSS